MWGGGLIKLDKCNDPKPQKKTHTNLEMHIYYTVKNVLQLIRFSQKYLANDIQNNKIDLQFTSLWDVFVHVKQVVHNVQLE